MSLFLERGARHFMSTPIGHSLAGVSIYFLSGCRFSSPGWKALFFCVIAACLPDIDFLPGFFVGNINYFHHKGTHTLFFALAVSLGVWFVSRKSGGIKGLSSAAPKWGLLTFILILSHLAVDYAAIDRTAPFGMPLLWPFSGKYFYFKYAFLPDVLRESSIASVFNRHNLRTVIVELAVFLPIALLSVILRSAATKNLYRFFPFVSLKGQNDTGLTKRGAP
jgi:membrane-bound metal-dependent hydrolase YbcI (DUF457 family)